MSIRHLSFCLSLACSVLIGISAPCCPGIEIVVPTARNCPTDGKTLDFRDCMVEKLLATPRPISQLLVGLGGLYECPCIHSHIRQRFEDNVTDKLARTGSNLSYLSIACGGLFQDLLILRRMVNAGKSVTTILVDSIFTALIEKHSDSYSLDLSYQSNGDHLPQIPFSWVGDLSEEVRERIRYPRYSTADLVANFAGWLNWRASSPCRVFVFGSLERYMTYVTSTGRLVADVAVGCDMPAEVVNLARQRVPRLLCLHSASSSQSNPGAAQPL